MEDIAILADETVLRAYEDIRTQVSTDARSPGYSFMGKAAKARADFLLSEIQRRGLSIAPIHWMD